MSLDQQKKAVAYIRISSTKQIDNESPETQREKIQQYADTNGIEIIKWYFDEAKSGKNTDREELQNMLTFALQYRGKIDHLIVYKMNRASRDLDSYVQSVRVVLKSKGISVRSATEPVDETKMGRFMEGLFVLLGQLDNDSKSEYTIDNMKALAEQGYWQHPPIVGYESTKILNERGQPRPTLKFSAMGPKVKQVLERYSEGDINKAELTRFATKIGLRSRYGNKLSEDSIHRLLKHPVYAGYVSDRFTEYELVPGKHPALISTITYERNQALLYPKNSRKGEVHLQKNSQYPLKGLLLCWNCRKPLYASAPTTGSGGKSPRYHCARPECRGKVKSVKAVVVHDDFEQLLARIKPSEGILKLYKTVLVRQANLELGRLNQHISSLREELSRIDSSRVNAVQKLTEGVITSEEKNQLTDMLDAQKIEKASDLRELEQQQNLREADVEYAITVMENVDKQWAESDIDIQIRFQKMIFPEGVVYDSESGNFGTTSISPLYRCIPSKKGATAPLKSDLVAHVHSNWNLLLPELNRWRSISKGLSPSTIYAG